jgi:hypothetical protein
MNIGAVLSLAFIAFLIAHPAYAYVDPGTGGMLTQLLTGGVAGLLVLGRLYWSRLSETLRRPSAKAARATEPAAHSHSVHG